MISTLKCNSAKIKFCVFFSTNFWNNKVFLLANNEKTIFKLCLDNYSLTNFASIPTDYMKDNTPSGLEFASFIVFDRKLMIAGGQIEPNVMTDKITFLDLKTGSLISQMKTKAPVCMHGAVIIDYKRKHLVGKVRVKEENQKLVITDSESDENDLSPNPAAEITHRDLRVRRKG